MDVKILFCNLLLILLVLCNGRDSKGIPGEILRMTTDNPRDPNVGILIEQVHSHPASLIRPVDPITMTFFPIEAQKPGNTMSIHFLKYAFNTFAHLLSKDEADSIPFSSQQLDILLHLFSIPKGSPQAKTMRDTLKACEREPLKGEALLCVSSIDSMVDFTQKIFGSQRELESVATAPVARSIAQNYTIIGVEKIASPKMVSCHSLAYPYSVFFCHVVAGESRVYRVSLTGEDGDRIEAISMCHMAASISQNHHASVILVATEPGKSSGTAPMCHFFHEDDLVWIPKQGQ